MTETMNREQIEELFLQILIHTSHILCEYLDLNEPTEGELKAMCDFPPAREANA